MANMQKIPILLLLALCLSGCQSSSQQSGQINKKTSIKIATFNVSMEATNYVASNEAGPTTVQQRLVAGDNQQIKNIAEILQHVRPDIVLLNEFDYIESPQLGVKAFIAHYLNQSQQGAQAIDYPYYYFAPVNTGVPTKFDLDNNGKKEGFKSDAHGFGFFPGHYGMVILSKYPIEQNKVRTFQHLLWSDMPGAIEPINPKTNKPWYSPQEWAALRLSSKSHWDVPVLVDGKVLHVMASHPTPPVFDGKEDRNGARNHDEIRFWKNYITPGEGGYIIDDKGFAGGLAKGSQFVILGDQNASLVEGDARIESLKALLESPRVNHTFIPQSEGGKQNKADSPHAKTHTASWGIRADYVLPSADIKIDGGGVFWPVKNDVLYRLIATRKASSDHRLVWLEIQW